MSFHDNKENAYHMLMLGLCATLRNIYTVKSNLEMGLGRSDITLIPKDKKYHPIIMEFKATGKEDAEKAEVQEEKLENLADEAIKQIADKKYYKTFEGKGFKDTMLMGISHHKKQCVVKIKYIDDSASKTHLASTC